MSFYKDSLVVEILANDPLYKKADGSLISSLIEKSKDYFGSKIDSNNKTGSLINLLAPGIVFTALKTIFPTWIRVLIALAMTVFHVDVEGILKSIYDAIKPIITGNKQVSSQQVNSIVSNIVQAHNQQFEDQENIFIKQENYIRDAKIIKLALIEYEQLEKLADRDSFSKKLFSAGIRRKIFPALTHVFSWFFTVALASAGFIVAGDAVNSLLGRSTTPTTKDSPSTIPSSYVSPASKQTKFKLNPSYNISEKFTPQDRIQRYLNNSNGIGQMIVDFANDVYDGLDNLENVIRSTAGFIVIVNTISTYNQASKDDPIVFIPPVFTSKKQMVDKFIDDVAKNA